MEFQQPRWNFEQSAHDPEGDDETSVNLRAYIDRIPDEKLAAYSPAFTDDELIARCGDFKDDGSLLLPCSERDVDAQEFRRVLESAIAFRAQ
jgi:hypothetical protein